MTHFGTCKKNSNFDALIAKFIITNPSYYFVFGLFFFDGLLLFFFYFWYWFSGC